MNAPSSPVKTLPRGLTSYDLFKTAALLLMMADHVGYFFYPEELWFRVFGRMCVPIWLFLVGYARSRDMGPQMWLGIALLVVTDLVVGRDILPVTILLTMIIIRAVIDRIGQVTLARRDSYGVVVFLVVMLTLPTMIVSEYGAQALLLALFGYYVRAEQDGDARAAGSFMWLHMTASLMVYVIFQYFSFLFPEPQFIVMAAGTAAVMLALRYFRLFIFAGTDRGILYILGTPFRFIGRHTLFLYVGHLVAIKLWLFTMAAA